MTVDMGNAETRDRTGDLQIFSLTLSQLSIAANEMGQAVAAVAMKPKHASAL